MNTKQLLALALICAGGYIAYDSSHAQPVPAPCPQPTPDDRRPPAPKPDPTPPCPQPKPKPKPSPWGDANKAPVGASVGGPTHPDGTELDCDMPGSLHKKNIASRGLGCCVFRSIDHAAIWQNVGCLVGFPEWMVKKGIEGGGYPQKVTQLIPKIAADRGQPTPQYIQVEGMDLEVLKAASRSGRMTSVTYSKSPTGRYGGQRIAHMVNLVHADDKHVVVLDNNYPGSDAFEWMSPEEFKRAYAPGWAVILLAPPPPPPPRGAR